MLEHLHEALGLEGLFLQNILIALALGILVGMERYGAPGKKFAGVRTMSLLCAGGALSVLVADAAGSVLPVVVYLVLGGLFSLAVVFLRVWTDQDSLGLTTSVTVFLIAVVGVLVGYDYLFEAVATTLIAVFLLTEKKSFRKYADMLTVEEISDAVKLGILALVLYPILPSEPVDPWGVLHLQEGLLFVIFILLIQFAAFVSLQWLRSRISFLLAAGLGGVVSSIAVVMSMVNLVNEKDLGDEAFSGAVVAMMAAVLRNGAIAVVLAPVLLEYLALPLAAAAVVASIFLIRHIWHASDMQPIDFGADSPFSFTSAFKFGVFFVVILLFSEVAQMYFSDAGIYAVAFLGGIGSSTAVVASAVTLLGSDPVTAFDASVMIVLGIISSMLTKIVYARIGGAAWLARQLVLPYALMAIALLTFLFLAT